jgi:RelB Antitoxin alpha helical domain
MAELKKRYIVDEQNRRITVQIDIEAFEKIEILENYALVQLMKNHR